MGNYEGTYFLDDFETSIENSEILSIDNETELIKKKNIYPNPSSKFITISGIQKEQAYKIYTLLGVEIVKGLINVNETIDVQNFRKGLYLLKLENDKPIKFIKE